VACGLPAALTPVFDSKTMICGLGGPPMQATLAQVRSLELCPAPPAVPSPVNSPWQTRLLDWTAPPRNSGVTGDIVGGAAVAKFRRWSGLRADVAGIVMQASSLLVGRGRLEACTTTVRSAATRSRRKDEHDG
jgi:hypothetical protein